MDFALDDDAQRLLLQSEQSNSHDGIFLREIVTPSSAPVRGEPPAKRRKRGRKNRQDSPTTTITTDSMKISTVGMAMSGKNPFMKFSYYRRHMGSVVPRGQFTNAFARQFLQGTEEEEEGEGGSAAATTDVKAMGNDVIANKKLRTLFVANPPFVTMDDVSDCVVEMMSCFGDVEAVHTGDLLPPQEHDIDHMLPSPFSDVRTLPFHTCGTLHVTFDTLDALHAAVKRNPMQERKKRSAERCSPIGLDHYRSEFASSIVRRGRLDSEMKRINRWMKRHDKTVEREESLIDALRNRPDKDGWTKVIAPRGKRHLPPMTEEDMMERREQHLMKHGSSSANRHLRLKQQAEQALEQSDGMDGAGDGKGQKQFVIYRFQRAEQQRERYSLLQEKFERDKEIIDRMRKQRLFSSSLAKGDQDGGALDR